MIVSDLRPGDDSVPNGNPVRWDAIDLKHLIHSNRPTEWNRPELTW